ncbi:MAG: type IV secretory system conjugative DNA transfer family protein, partial [Pseudomonadota bacterium]
MNLVHTWVWLAFFWVPVATMAYAAFLKATNRPAYEAHLQAIPSELGGELIHSVQSSRGKFLASYAAVWFVTSVFFSLIPLPGALAGILVLIYAAYAVVFLFTAFILFMSSSSSTQGREILTNADTYRRVRKVLGASEFGSVVAGQLPKNKELLKTSVQDRAIVIGPPGTGKTTFLVTQLLEWAEQGLPFVCFDTKPEIYGIVRERLEGQYRLLTYNPTAGTGERYNPLDDAPDPLAVSELVAALIPTVSPENEAIYESSRQIVESIALHLRESNSRIALPDISAFMKDRGDLKRIISALRESPNEDVVETANFVAETAKSDRFMGNVYADLAKNLKFLRQPAIRESLSTSDFSLADFAQGSGATGLFLQFEQRHKAVTSRLFSAFVTHITNYFIAHHHDRPPILLMLDE